MSDGRTVEIDLRSDLVAFFRSELTRLGYVGVHEPDDSELPIIYFDVCKRLVTPDPRKIHKAKGFFCPDEFRSALVTIERKLHMGEDIIPYLSKKITNLRATCKTMRDLGVRPAIGIGRAQSIV